MLHMGNLDIYRMHFLQVIVNGHDDITIATTSLKYNRDLDDMSPNSLFPCYSDNSLFKSYRVRKTYNK